MLMNTLPRLAAAFSLALMLAVSSVDALAQQITPLRLSYVEGEVSFWRFGAEDWAEARHNIPLAAGDELYVGSRGVIELQAGSRAFVRADSDTQLSLLTQTADFLQFRITTGRVSFDLRTLPAGYSVEVNTPNAAFTIDRSGYYRVDVDGEVHFITRRGGRAVMVPAGGQPMNIYPSEEIVVRGDGVARAETYVAPEPDRWDRWNYERTDSFLDAVSERYLSPGVAGAYDLDHYGRWRVVAEYGPVWVPEVVPVGWAPYSSGRWIWDPYYEWTWIDDAPWGWAPFHYGRWVFIGGYWAWAPGPVFGVSVYAPALVAFFDLGSSLSVSIGFGTPGLAWVSLGWGEPVLPWWGRPGFVGRPWWGGWWGPRVVNDVVVKQTTVINVSNISYVNSRVNNAVVATHRERFTRGGWNDKQRRLTNTTQTRLLPVRGALPVKPEPVSLIAGSRRSVRPPEAVLKRPVVVKRVPSEPKLPWRVVTAALPEPERRFVSVPARPVGPAVRPALGGETGIERARPPLPPRFEERQRQPQPPQPAAATRKRERIPPSMAEPPVPRATEQQRQRESQPAQPAPMSGERERVETPQPQPRAPRVVTTAPAQPRAVEQQERQRVPAEPPRVETPVRPPQAAPAPTRQPELAELPGKPANRVYRVPQRENEDQDQRPPQDGR